MSTSDLTVGYLIPGPVCLVCAGIPVTGDVPIVAGSELASERCGDCWTVLS